MIIIAHVQRVKRATASLGLGLGLYILRVYSAIPTATPLPNCTRLKAPCTRLKAPWSGTTNYLVHYNINFVVVPKHKLACYLFTSYAYEYVTLEAIQVLRNASGGGGGGGVTQRYVALQGGGGCWYLCYVTPAFILPYVILLCRFALL